ncbi:MAG TPA: hypothetical protein VGJ91_10515 [Polyangiaceae bacterium]
MLLTLLSRVGPVVLGGALRIQSELACPDPAEVSANVQKLLDLSDESAEALQATVRRDGSWLVLSLTEADGSSLGEHRVAYDADCTMLARAAAVVFAAWLSNEHPEFLVALPPEGSPLQPNGAPGPAPDANPSPAAPLASPPTAPLAPASVPVRVTPRAAPASAQATPSPMAERRFVLGAGIGGAVASGSGFAPALALGAAWDPGRHGWGARIGVAWLGTRSEPLGERELSWTRWPLLSGPFLRLRAGRSSLDLEAGLALAWTRVTGHGFASSTTDSGLTFGGYAGLRFVPIQTPLQVFAQAAPMFWLGDSTAVATDANGAAISRNLPSFELLFTLGAELPL